MHFPKLGIFPERDSFVLFAFVASHCEIDNKAELLSCQQLLAIQKLVLSNVGVSFCVPLLCQFLKRFVWDKPIF